MRWLLYALLPLLFACGGPPCRLQNDCPIGYYCILDIPVAGKAEGTCRRDCKTSADCEQPGGAYRAYCSNEGRCRTQARPPELRVLEPEVDSLYPEGTRRVRVSGEVESAAERVVIRAASRMQDGCGGGGQRTISIDNPTPGDFVVLPFVMDDLVVDPGRHTLEVVASVEASERRVQIEFEVPCPGCAKINILRPTSSEPIGRLEIPVLAGTIDPLVRSAVWRVHSPMGALFDGRLSVSTDSAFYLERIPLFPGQNRLEVVVTGVGSGLGESRCSTLVFSGIAVERGLRLLLSWDSGADLDLHLVGPGGHYGDLATSLSARSPAPVFGGSVEDDADGFGPEVIQLEDVPDGVYGVVVEPVFDQAGQGANAFVRILHKGTLVTGAIGPQYVSADRGELWVAGKLEKSGDTATFTPVNQIVPASVPPTTSPDVWPTLY